MLNKIKYKKWLLKKFKVDLNIPLERCKIRLTFPLFKLSIKADGKMLYPEDYIDKNKKYVIFIEGNRCKVSNFSFANFNKGLCFGNGYQSLGVM